MLDLTIWVSGADFIEMGSFWPRKFTLFCRKWVRRLKYLVLKGSRRVLCEVDRGRPNLGQSLGHFLDVSLELEAETLSESRFFNARSDHMGFRS